MSGITIERMPRDASGRVQPTMRQRELLAAIDRLTRKRGFAPTIRELEAELKAKSPNAIAQKLHFLRRKGWVQWEPRLARTLRITGGLS
jgi:SOS-response transcriptional repressor LexA